MARKENEESGREEQWKGDLEMGTIAGQVTNAILPLAGTSDSSSPFFFFSFFFLTASIS